MVFLTFYILLILASILNKQILFFIDTFKEKIYILYLRDDFPAVWTLNRT